jgi:hypothetical protein
VTPRPRRATGAAVDLAEIEATVVSARKNGRLLGCRLILAHGLDAELFAEIAEFLEGAGAAGLLALDVLHQLPEAQLLARLAASGTDADPAGEE